MPNRTATAVAGDSSSLAPKMGDNVPEINDARQTPGARALEAAAARRRVEREGRA